MKNIHCPYNVNLAIRIFNFSRCLFTWCTFLYLIDKIFVVQICERSNCFSATVECINKY